MSDPDVVKIIEKSFVPLLIKNNVGGNDAKMLKRFGEPAWNFQVIRFLDANGKDIIPRKDRVWDKASLLKRIVLALKKSNNPIPESLTK